MPLLWGQLRREKCSTRERALLLPSANDNGMGIRVRGIPENESKSLDERLHADMNI